MLVSINFRDVIISTDKFNGIVNPAWAGLRCASFRRHCGVRFIHAHFGFRVSGMDTKFAALHLIPPKRDYFIKAILTYYENVNYILEHSLC